MARTRRKELVFFLKDPEKQAKFLETVHKKITMVNIHIESKLDKIRLTISGTHESVRYAIQIIRGIETALKS